MVLSTTPDLSAFYVDPAKRDAVFGQPTYGVPVVCSRAGGAYAASLKRLPRPAGFESGSNISVVGAADLDGDGRAALVMQLRGGLGGTPSPGTTRVTYAFSK